MGEKNTQTQHAQLTLTLTLTLEANKVASTTIRTKGREKDYDANAFGSWKRPHKQCTLQPSQHL